eukprot:snap_masked-scaffold_6-processed-gene-2.15-mRNA-1 protein AED:1.00 eAED:1.00 QI:0/0/0/0/1/1/2/0/70
MILFFAEPTFNLDYPIHFGYHYTLYAKVVEIYPNLHTGLCLVAVNIYARNIVILMFFNKTRFMMDEVLFQ